LLFFAANFAEFENYYAKNRNWPPHRRSRDVYAEWPIPTTLTLAARSANNAADLTTAPPQAVRAEQKTASNARFAPERMLAIKP